jgi:hypothetical protein
MVRDPGTLKKNTRKYYNEPMKKNDRADVRDFVEAGIGKDEVDELL